MNNRDEKTIDSFGSEWSRHDQSDLAEDEALRIFDEYFSVFDWNALPEEAEGFDMGCGSGRWSRFVAMRVAKLHCIDPSVAIEVAKINLSGFANVTFHKAAVDDDILAPASQDFGFSLGVLHHVPDTVSAMRSCANLLKPGAPLLVYLYYAFDNRPWWFRAIWKVSDAVRRMVRALPEAPKNLVTDLIAVVVYLPLAYFSKLLELMGVSVQSIPLSYYRNHSFYTMRTDSRDRFGTPLEKRFTKNEIEAMMEEAGLGNITFSENAPFWCAVGYRIS